MGDSFTDGAVFDSFGFRGVSLASDDQMLPDSQLEYAPVVHGIAQTNARVVITQNGNTILETTVSPGAFEINDLYATGYGGDLHVTVYEADGTQNTFTVPYASLVQLLRPGVWRYAVTAGEVQQPSLTGTERFAQATLQHGFNNYLTGYTGAVGAQHYAAGLLGHRPQHPAGCRGGRCDRSQSRHHGCLFLQRPEPAPQLQQARSATRRPTSRSPPTATPPAATIPSAMRKRPASCARAGASPDTVERARSQWQININQTLPRRWGNFYLTASVRDYWNAPGTTTQFQGGYTNHFRFGGTSLSYSISVARQNNAQTGKARQPGAGELLAAPGTFSTLAHALDQFQPGHDRRTCARAADRKSINGTLGENNQLSYSASASQSSGQIPTRPAASTAVPTPACPPASARAAAIPSSHWEPREEWWSIPGASPWPTR